MKATLTGLGAYLMCLLPLPMEAAEPSAVSEIWAIRYHAGHLDPASDDDGDGLSNAEESVAGTDPLDGTSFPRAVVTAIVGSKVQLVIAQPEPLRAEPRPRPCQPTFHGDAALEHAVEQWV